jgi:mannose-6-phosphate isomerase-like protein (cupin superfamily)
MMGYVKNIGEEAIGNDNFRKVVYTAKHCQLVLMALKPKEDIGEEVHDNVDQFFRIEQGEGMAVLDGVEHELKAEFAVLVPAGTKHNIINTSDTDALKLYTIYSPPNHQKDIIHVTKADAMADEGKEHFDGKTTE